MLCDCCDEVTEGDGSDGGNGGARTVVLFTACPLDAGPYSCGDTEGVRCQHGPW